MKVSCLQENLSKGLALVGRAVAPRSTLPITANVLIATDSSRLKLAATNLEISIVAWIGAKVEEEGAITVPARLLTEFVSSLPTERIDMVLSPKTRSLQVRCARFEANISGMDAEDFPPVPQVSDGAAAEIDPEELRKAISRVAFAAATEDSRPVLTGVQMELKDQKFTCAAADGFRLAVYSGSLAKGPGDPITVIVPARALSELSRLLADQKEPVQMTVNLKRSQVLFKLNNSQLVAQLIQGTFPNYQQLIPQKYETRAVMDVSEFLRATRAASIFARDSSGIVRVQITEPAKSGSGSVSISARADEVGEDRGEIDAEVEGAASKIAFNSKYLADVLSVLEVKKVALETTGPSSPGLFRPVDGDGYIHVVMPMFVQW